MVQYFGDIDVGSVIELSSFEMKSDEIKSFAEQYDPLPFHIDEEVAAETRFSGIIASGFHTLVAANRVVIEEFKSDLAAIAGLGIDDLSWREPVRPGDVLTPTVEIIEKHRLDDTPNQGVLRFKIVTRNQFETVVISHVETALIKESPDSDM